MPRPRAVALAGVALLLLTVGIGSPGVSSLVAGRPSVEAAGPGSQSAKVDTNGSFETSSGARADREDLAAPTADGADAPDAADAYAPVGGSFRRQALEAASGPGVRAIGRARRDVLIGSQAADILSGGGGRDRLVGGRGGDVLTGGRGGDVLLGGAGVDHIEGGPGGDTISAGSGMDVVEGGAGDDLIRTWQDRTPDLVDCGSGDEDRAVIDATDTTSACEVVVTR
jgi:hypothetical protein